MDILMCPGRLPQSCFTRAVDVKCVLPAVFVQKCFESASGLGAEQVCSSSCLLWPCLFFM